jgi:hypothetical protein
VVAGPAAGIRELDGRPFTAGIAGWDVEGRSCTRCALGVMGPGLNPQCRFDVVHTNQHHGRRAPGPGRR